MNLRKRLEAIIKLHRYSIAKGETSGFLLDVMENIRDHNANEFQMNKGRPKPRSIYNLKRYHFIKSIQDRCQESFFNVPREVSGFVVTEILCEIRKMKDSENFETFIKEIWEASKMSELENKGKKVLV